MLPSAHLELEHTELIAAVKAPVTMHAAASILRLRSTILRAQPKEFSNVSAAVGPQRSPYLEIETTHLISLCAFIKLAIDRLFSRARRKALGVILSTVDILSIGA